MTEATTLTAVYEDAPVAKKDGLSGGAIAGIVIGSVAARRNRRICNLLVCNQAKRRLRTLGVALKKVFTAIGNFFKNLGAKIKALFTKKEIR